MRRSGDLEDAPDIIAVFSAMSLQSGLMLSDGAACMMSEQGLYRCCQSADRNISFCDTPSAAPRHRFVGLRAVEPPGSCRANCGDCGTCIVEDISCAAASKLYRNPSPTYKKAEEFQAGCLHKASQRPMPMLLRGKFP